MSKRDDLWKRMAERFVADHANEEWPDWEPPKNLQESVKRIRQMMEEQDQRDYESLSNLSNAFTEFARNIGADQSLNGGLRTEVVVLLGEQMDALMVEVEEYIKEALDEESENETE